MAKIGFIGCGNMGGSLVKAVAAAGFGSDILLADYSAVRTAELSELTGAAVSDARTVAAGCDYIFIGVKPQALGVCFDEIKDDLAANPGAVLISMAAGVCIEDIRTYSGCKSIIRIMPNLPVAICKGIVLASDSGVDRDKKEFFSEIMKCCGIFDWIDEKLIDSASALSGCGPAFVYMFIEALADGAVACGLPRDKALLYAAGTVSGAAENFLQSGKHPGKLKDEVCSPGGSTIMGVKALEDGAFRADVMNAVISAYKKTLELGEKK
ncbi:MAG: pyrroline-5-carboxylate reductase [Clostridia bacterium]|nr:pyrroline-5-carboxylate reductase [Clostridia bacterium]